MFSIKIRNLEEKDIIKLAEFLPLGLPIKSADQWKNLFCMWWIDNPLMNPDFPRGWVLEKNGSEIIGFLGNIPVKFQINGTKGIAAAASSWYVKPEFQGFYSILLLLEFMKQKNVNLFLSTTPSEKVRKINLKLGFSTIELPFNNSEYWYIINHQKFIHFLLNKRIKSCKLLSIIIKIVSFSIEFILPIRGILKKKKEAKLKNNEFDCSICTYCDDSFTELWENNKKENTTTLYRDAETLNWLYFSKAVKNKRYVLKCIQKENNKLVGYMVLDTTAQNKEDINNLQLMDVYIPDIKEEIVLSLISSSIDMAKKFDVGALKFWAINQEMEKILKKIIKIRRHKIYEYLYKLNKMDELETNEKKNHEFIPSRIDPDRGII